MSNSGFVGQHRELVWPESWRSEPLDIGAMPPKIHLRFVPRFAPQVVLTKTKPKEPGRQKHTHSPSQDQHPPQLRKDAAPESSATRTPGRCLPGRFRPLARVMPAARVRPCDFGTPHGATDQVMRFRPANISLINSRFPLADDSAAAPEHHELNQKHYSENSPAHNT